MPRPPKKTVEEEAWISQFKGWLVATREARGWTQAKMAEFLGWPKPKVSKLENSTQAPSLADLLALQKALDVILVRQPGQEDDGEVRPSQLVSVRRASPLRILPDHLLDALEGKEQDLSHPPFFCLHDGIRVVLGARIPESLRIKDPSIPEVIRASLKKLVTSMQKRHSISAERFDRLEFLPVIKKGDVAGLVKPTTHEWGPVYPDLRTIFRGPDMHHYGPRLVADPSTLEVTLIETPTLVLYPLRVIFVIGLKTMNADGDKPDYRRVQSRCVRLAAYLTSQWARNWMRKTRSLWFSREDGPVRDVLVPADLWIAEDGPALDLETIGNDLLALSSTDKRRQPLLRRLDEVVMSYVRPVALA